MTNFKKLSAVVLGSLLAIGVGAGVVANNDNAQATHAADVVDSFSVKGFGGYSGSSYTTAVQTATGATSGVTYQASNFMGSNGQIKGNGTIATNFYIRNTTAYSGYYISKISLTVSGGTLTGNTAGSSVVAYGTAAIAANNTTGVILDDQNAAAQATLTWTVANPTTSQYTYFCVNNIKTSGTALAATATALQITWTPAATSSKVLTDELELSGSLTNTTQFVGQKLNIAGLTVTAVYDDSSTSVLNAAQLTLPTLVYGTNSYQISYTEGSVTATAMVGVTVAQDTVASLSWTGRVTTFNEGSVFTLGAGAVTATYASSATAPVTLANLTVYVFEGTFDAGTARVLAPTDTFVMADNGKSIVLGYQGVYTTSSVLTIKFVPTTTYGSNGATLVTNASNLAIGDSIVVTAAAGTYALGTTQGSNNRNAVAIVVADNAISPVGSDVQVLTIAAGTKANTFALNTGSGYLYAASSSSNYLKTQATIDDNASFAITITEAGVATITAQGTNTRNIIKFNSTNNPPIFSCYSTGQADVSIFKISGGYNYDFVLGMLDGDYCSASLEELNLAVARHDAMTAHEIAHLESVTVVGKDSVSYTGLAAYQALLARRNALAAAGIGGNGNFNMEDTSVIAIITIISLVGVSAIGGFFYFKKKHLA